MTLIYWPRILTALLLLSVLATSVQASGGTPIDRAQVLLVPADAQLLLDDVLASGDWQPLKGKSPNFGYIDETVWLRFPVPDEKSLNLLEISYAHLDQIRFFLLADGEVVKRTTAGDRFPFDQRPILHRHFLFPFERTERADYEILLQVRTTGAVQVPLTFWHDKTFFEEAFIEDQLHAIYYGVLIAVIAFNLFVFVALRERVHLLYCLSTLGYLLLICTLNGITFQALWPESPAIQNKAMLLSIPGALVFTLWFARAYLNIGATSRTLEKTVDAAIGINILAGLATFVLDYSTAIQMLVGLSMPSSLLLTIVGPQQWLRGNRQGVYYTLAWGLLTLGSAITAANKLGFLPNNFLTLYAMQIGSALQAILLAMAMAIKLLQERQDKIEARDAELRAMEARRDAELRLMDHALHNPLTGLPNRASFEMSLNDLLLRKPGQRHAVTVIQLNNLDAVTKTLGHNNSEELLTHVSREFNRIVSTVPGVKVVEQGNYHAHYLASLDPKTFAFLVNADKAESEPQEIVRLLEEVRAPINFLGMQVPLDARMGVAIFPEHGRDATTLIRRAAIAEGSDRAIERGMAYYKPIRDLFSADRLTMVSELRQALAEQQLELYLQPKLSLSTNEVVGLEALIRWKDKQEQIRPDELVLLAEQTGVIKPLTRWALEQSLAMCKTLNERGWPLGISVNISPNNLLEPDFPDFVQQLMEEQSHQPGQITLEITETSMMRDPTNSLAALRQLEAFGNPLSIDDFGSGYSSLSYIKQLPASEIKIDRSLISDLINQSEDRVIVKTTINMCHDLGYRVVAEGVEDEATASLLKDMGCDMIQGYLVAPPLSFDDTLTWLDSTAGQQRKLG